MKDEIIFPVAELPKVVRDEVMSYMPTRDLFSLMSPVTDLMLEYQHLSNRISSNMLWQLALSEQEVWTAPAPALSSEQESSTGLNQLEKRYTQFCQANRGGAFNFSELFYWLIILTGYEDRLVSLYKHLEYYREMRGNSDTIFYSKLFQHVFAKNIKDLNNQHLVDIFANIQDGERLSACVLAGIKIILPQMIESRDTGLRKFLYYYFNAQSRHRILEATLENIALICASNDGREKYIKFVIDQGLFQLPPTSARLKPYFFNMIPANLRLDKSLCSVMESYFNDPLTADFLRILKELIKNPDNQASQEKCIEALDQSLCNIRKRLIAHMDQLTPEDIAFDAPWEDLKQLTILLNIKPTSRSAQKIDNKILYTAATQNPQFLDRLLEDNKKYSDSILPILETDLYEDDRSYYGSDDEYLDSDDENYDSDYDLNEQQLISQKLDQEWIIMSLVSDICSKPDSDSPELLESLNILKKYRINFCGSSPLLKAVECCRLELVRVLLENTNIHKSVLTVAVRCYLEVSKPSGGDSISDRKRQLEKTHAWEILLIFLGRGADVSVQDGSGNTPLHTATEHGNQAIVSLLLQYGANPNLQNYYKEPYTGASDLDSTPLHIAAEGGHEAIVSLLLQYGAGVNRKDYWGNTPVHVAVRYARVGLLPLFFENQDQVVDVEILNNAGETALHEAPNESTVKVLIDYGYKINAKNTKGNTLLHLAAREERRLWRQAGRYKLISPLVQQYGADLHARNKEGNTPLGEAIALHLVAGVKYDTLLITREIIVVLLKLGAKIDAQNAQGNTALHQAIEMMCHEIQTRSPFSDARFWRDIIGIIQELLEHGAHIDTRNNAGETPLSLATPTMRACMLAFEKNRRMHDTPRTQDKSSGFASAHALFASLLPPCDPHHPESTQPSL